jgi:hypothetical protein
MRLFRMKRALLPLFAVSLIALSACSGEEPGDALATDPTAGAGSAAPSTSAAESSAAGAPTASVDPCSLVSPADLGEFGSFGSGAPDEVGGARTCSFQKELDSASDDTLGIGIAVRDSQGVDEVSDLGNGNQTGKVPSGRKAVQTSGGGTCLIALAVGENSRVDVGATAATAEQACPIADAVAKIVEPKLPEG